VTEAALSAEGGILGIGNAAAARLIALLLPLALLGGALGSQYLGSLHPCEMCYWQRWPHGAAAVLAALALSASAQSQRSRVLVLLAALAIAVSGAIAIYHAGVELGIFEGFTRADVTRTQIFRQQRHHRLAGLQGEIVARHHLALCNLFLKLFDS